MPAEKFNSIYDIPDLLPSQLLIPSHREDLRIPRMAEHAAGLTSPLEVGYILFSSGGLFAPYRNRLENHFMQEQNPDDFLNHSWMNHTGRVVVRAALDPDRYAPIDMCAVYENEEGSARNPTVSDRTFFKDFIKTWGVLANRG